MKLSIKRHVYAVCSRPTTRPHAPVHVPVLRGAGYRATPAWTFGTTKPCFNRLDYNTRLLCDRPSCLTHLIQRRKAVRLPVQMSGDAQTAILAGGALIDFGIQILGWCVAVVLRTESFYDALGTVSYLALALGSLAYGGDYQWRQVTMTTLVSVWTLRLGSFLLLRVLRTGGDSRFDELKHKPLQFLVAWILQALWAWVVSLPLLLLNATGAPDAAFNDVHWTDVVGILAWTVGFFIETVADFQKLAFKSDPANKGKFIQTGLWASSRYPNYFGEMLLWWGIFLGCSASFHGAEWLAVASPLFVAFLLLFVSGIPLQERQAQARWGEDEEYQAYRARTNLLLPLPRFSK